MIVNPNGGSQKAPEITVNSSGLITATAGKKSATKQLDSSMDASFVASNIRKGVDIFGVVGTMTPHASTSISTYSEYTAGDGFVEFPAYVGYTSTSDAISMKTVWVEIVIGTPTQSFHERYIFVANDLKISGSTGWCSLYRLDDGLFDLDDFSASLTYNSGTGEVKLRLEHAEAFANLGTSTTDDYHVYSASGACTVSF